MSNQRVRHFIGLDLAQTHEFTALAILERPEVTLHTPTSQRRPCYTLGFLDRFPLGTPYPDIVKCVREILQRPKLQDPFLMIDQTGVGGAVIEMLLDGLRNQVTCGYLCVTIAAGHEKGTLQGNDLVLPRKELVGVLQVLLQSRRLQIPRTLPHASLLVQELERFKAKVTLAGQKDALEQWRESEQDDLVLAVALAAWVAEKALPGLYDQPEDTRPLVIRT